MRHVLPHSSDSDPEDNSDLERRWRFDADDEPVIGPDGPDEHDRVLIDDFDSQYVFTIHLSRDETTHLIVGTSCTQRP